MSSPPASPSAPIRLTMSKLTAAAMVSRIRNQERMQAFQQQDEQLPQHHHQEEQQQQQQQQQHDSHHHPKLQPHNQELRPTQTPPLAQPLPEPPTQPQSPHQNGPQHSPQPQPSPPPTHPHQTNQQTQVQTHSSGSHTSATTRHPRRARGSRVFSSEGSNRVIYLMLAAAVFVFIILVTVLIIVKKPKDAPAIIPTTVFNPTTTGSFSGTTPTYLL